MPHNLRTSVVDMAASQDRSEFISELINLLAGPVTAGVKKAGEANRKRMEIQEHVEHLVGELQHTIAVGQRLVRLLDDIEEPLRAALPQLTRAADLLGRILDEAPDDLPTKLRSSAESLTKLADGLGPLMLLAQGAAGMFGGSARPASAPTSATARTASKPPAGTSAKSSSAAKKSTRTPPKTSSSATPVKKRATSKKS